MLPGTVSKQSRRISHDDFETKELTATTKLDEVKSSLLLQHLTKLPRVLSGQPILLELHTIQLDADYKARRAGYTFPDLSSNLQNEPGSVADATSIPIRPLIRRFRHKLGEQVSVRGMQLYPIVTSAIQILGCVCETVYGSQDILFCGSARSPKDMPIAFLSWISDAEMGCGWIHSSTCLPG